MDDGHDLGAIHRLLGSYVIGVDCRDLALLAECFAPEAEIEFALMTRMTAAEYLALCREMLPGFDATHHALGMPVVRIEGDRAWSRTYVTAQHTRNALLPDPHLTAGGWYDDVIERRDGRWLIVRRVGTTLWVSGNPEVLGGFPIGAPPRGDGHQAPRWLRPEHAGEVPA